MMPLDFKPSTILFEQAIYQYFVSELNKLISRSAIYESRHNEIASVTLSEQQTSPLDYSIVVQQVTHEVDDYILEIRSKNGIIKIKKSPAEISKDKALLALLNPMQANRIGYLAGVQDTVKEYQSMRDKAYDKS